MAQFSTQVMEHFQEPYHRGLRERPHRAGFAGWPGRSRYLALQLWLEGERVVEARFEAEGCGVTIAVGSMLTELIEQQTLTFCAALTAEDVLEALGGLPSHKQDRAALAIAALQQALQDSPAP